VSALDIFAGIGLVLLFLATAGLRLMIWPIFWGQSRDAWRQMPRERRPRALAFGAVMALFVAAGGAVLFLAPWGNDTVVWVFAAFAGLLLIWGLATAAIESRRAAERVKRKTPQGHVKP
jgi:hypothetical protein